MLLSCTHVYLLSIRSSAKYCNCIHCKGSQVLLLWHLRQNLEALYIDDGKPCGLQRSYQQHFHLSTGVSIVTLWFSLLSQLLFASIPSFPVPCTSAFINLHLGKSLHRALINMYIESKLHTTIAVQYKFCGHSLQFTRLKSTCKSLLKYTPQSVHIAMKFN